MIILLILIDFIVIEIKRYLNKANQTHTNLMQWILISGILLQNVLFYLYMLIEAVENYISTSSYAVYELFATSTITIVISLILYKISSHFLNKNKEEEKVD